MWINVAVFMLLKFLLSCALLEMRVFLNCNLSKFRKFPSYLGVGLSDLTIFRVTVLHLVK